MTQQGELVGRAGEGCEGEERGAEWRGEGEGDVQRAGQGSAGQGRAGQGRAGQGHSAENLELA